MKKTSLLDVCTQSSLLIFLLERHNGENGMDKKSYTKQTYKIITLQSNSFT